MSADNGIYILKYKNGYRVTHAQAIENIFMSNNRKLNPIEVINYWKDCKYTKDFNTAMNIAKAMNIRIHTEYGIKIFEYNKTWKHIIEDAKEKAKIEIDRIKTCNNTNPNLKHFNDYYINKCNEILKM